MIEITDIKKIDCLEEKWLTFKPYMIESLYNKTEEVYVKTYWGAVFQCSVQWAQGFKNNYYFGDTFGNDIRSISISDVTHYIKIC